MKKLKIKTKNKRKNKSICRFGLRIRDPAKFDNLIKIILKIKNY